MLDLQLYRRVQDGFDAVLAGITPRQWDAPTPCPGWSVRDVAGHVIWGQDSLWHWANGTEHGNTEGLPGAPNPGVLAGDDPLATWRSARARSMTALPGVDPASTAEVGDELVPAAEMLMIMAFDQFVHTWDIGHAVGTDPRPEPDLLRTMFDWAIDGVRFREPGFFDEALTPPDDADEQTRFLAFLGRAPWQPHSA